MSQQKMMKQRHDMDAACNFSEKKGMRKEMREQGLSKMSNYLFMKQEMARIDKERQLDQETS